MLFLAIPYGVKAQNFMVTTLAGQIGSSGGADGVGTSARFSSIRGMTADRAGNLYVTDSVNGTIRKITATGVVTTVAGAAGVREYRNGTGSVAHFFAPNSITCDSTGTLYVDDRNNQTLTNHVRKISPPGEVTTFVSPTMASNFTALAVDSAGHLIVGANGGAQWFDSNGQTFLPRWSPGAVVSPDPKAPPRFLGDIGAVSGLAMDQTDTIWVADGIHFEIRKVLPSGVMTSVAGSAGTAGYVDATGASARFKSPGSIAIDSVGNLYVADSGAVRRITPAGVVTTIAGSPDVLVPNVQDGIGGVARFQGTISLAIGSGDTLYISDETTIRKATPTSAVGVLAPTIASSPQHSTIASGERATFSVTVYGVPKPTSQWQRSSAGSTVWMDLSDSGVYSGTTSATLAISDTTPAMNGDQFRCVTTNAGGTTVSPSATLIIDPPVVVVPLRVTTLAGPPGGSSKYQPRYVATDAAGNVFVVDAAGYCIRKITPSGTVSTIVAPTKINQGAKGATLGQVTFLGPVAVDAEGNVYFVEELFVFGDPTTPSPFVLTTATIRKITPSGGMTVFAQDDASGRTFGTVGAMAFDRTGNLAVTTSNGSVVKISPDGKNVTAIPILATRLKGPIAFDSSGNFILADNNVVSRVAPNGIMNSVIAGTPNQSGAVDGRGRFARFSSVNGVAVDASGNVYVVDTATIRRISTDGIVSTVASTKPVSGQPIPTGNTDGIGPIARFDAPGCITIDRAGNLYIVDANNFSIRKAVPVDAVALGESAELDVSVTTNDAVTPADGFSTLAASDSAGHRAIAAAAGCSYQWLKDSVAIAGATGAQLRFPATTLRDAGSYQVQSVTGNAVATSAPVTLTVNGGRLSNLSIRSGSGPGTDAFIVGFVVAGEGLPLLIRGVGPGLATFGITAPAAHPAITLYANSGIVASNSGWANAADIAETGTRVGAFALPGDSADAAVLTTLPGGATTVQCTSTGPSAAVALVELYDANVQDSGRSRLVNLSARTRTGTGDNVMIAGFVIRGSTARRLLLRGIGPTLAQFAVVDALADTSLKLMDGKGGLIAQNDGWSNNGDAAEISAVAQAVGAFALPLRSKDSAMLVTLAPGAYSVQLSGKAAGTGIGMIEVYDAP